MGADHSCKRPSLRPSVARTTSPHHRVAPRRRLRPSQSTGCPTPADHHPGTGADCHGPSALAPDFVVSPTRVIPDRRSLALYCETRFTLTTRIAGENLRYPLVNAKSRGPKPRLFALVSVLWQGFAASGVSCWMRERLGARPPSGALGAGWTAKSLRFERDLVPGYVSGVGVMALGFKR